MTRIRLERRNTPQLAYIEIKLRSVNYTLIIWGVP